MLTGTFYNYQRKKHVNVPTHRVQRIHSSKSAKSSLKNISSMTHSIPLRVSVFMLIQFVSEDSNHQGVVGSKEKNLPSVSIKLAQLLLVRTIVKDCFS